MRYAFLLAVLLPTAGFADSPVIERVEARENSGSWTFSVTLSHPDTGWDHYADGWEILAPDGTVLGSRPLAHPHVNEQPFTRSVSGVRIPDDITEVTIRSRCNVDEWAEETVQFKLPR